MLACGPRPLVKPVTLIAAALAAMPATLATSPPPRPPIFHRPPTAVKDEKIADSSHGVRETDGRRVVSSGLAMPRRSSARWRTRPEVWMTGRTREPDVHIARCMRAGRRLVHSLVGPAAARPWPGSTRYVPLFPSRRRLRSPVTHRHRPERKSAAAPARSPPVSRHLPPRALRARAYGRDRRGIHRHSPSTRGSWQPPSPTSCGRRTRTAILCSQHVHNAGGPARGIHTG